METVGYSDFELQYVHLNSVRRYELDFDIKYSDKFSLSKTLAKRFETILVEEYGTLSKEFYDDELDNYENDTYTFYLRLGNYSDVTRKNLQTKKTASKENFLNKYNSLAETAKSNVNSKVLKLFTDFEKVGLKITLDNLFVKGGVRYYFDGENPIGTLSEEIYVDIRFKVEKL
jgi:hypothetical protein